jgi:hypothetical protein
MSVKCQVKKQNEIEQNLTKRELANKLANDFKEQGFDKVLLSVINNKDLTITQSGMIIDFIGGKTITKISEDFKISRTTIYKLLGDKVIQKIIRSYQADFFNDSFIFLKDLNFKAMLELKGQLQGDNPRRRLEVAKYIIDTNIKLMELWEKKSLELTEKKKGNESIRKIRIEEEKKSLKGGEKD